MIQGILRWLFYLLFFITPLFFTRYNHELFEFNKMLLVYALTAIIAGVWLIKIFLSGRLILKSTPIDIPLILFLISQILSTIFSIDPHTSIWGYYTRSNGGLLSIFCYILLFYALVSNFEKKDVLRLLYSVLAGGILVTLYAIPEHFGVSPSCLILVQKATDGCWVQDVQSRVFATLGQPNWLAAYLEMLIFPCLYLFFKEKEGRIKYLWGVSAVLMYLGFTFTYSRGGMIGFLVGLGVFILGFIFLNQKKVKKEQNQLEGFRPLGVIILVFLLINLFFGSALSRFKLLAEAPPAPRAQSAAVTQLESGGTESGQIRLIVWKGAFEIFKHYPLLGSGVETFAYSYYQFRPVEHNLVSEWDFLYNKAHNEYLNYLATTGILGLGTYLAFILAFLIWGVRQILKSKVDHDTKLFILAILASYISYLVQNSVEFSVVIIALLFYVMPGMAFVYAEVPVDARVNFFNRGFIILFRSIFNTIVGNPRISKIACLCVGIIVVIFIWKIYGIWHADTVYNLGADFIDSSDVGEGYKYLVKAANENKGEPLYRSDLGFASSAAAVGYIDRDATLSGQLKDDAVTQTELALSISPANVSLWRTAIRTYYQLSLIDNQYEKKTLEVMDHTIALAPTDPKLYFNKAQILQQNGQVDQAVEVIKKAIELKPNYRDAYLTLGSYYQELKQNDKAKDAYETVLKLVPNDQDALKKLEELKG